MQSFCPESIPASRRPTASTCNLTESMAEQHVSDCNCMGSNLPPREKTIFFKRPDSLGERAKVQSCNSVSLKEIPPLPRALGTACLGTRQPCSCGCVPEGDAADVSSSGRKGRIPPVPAQGRSL